MSPRAAGPPLPPGRPAAAGPFPARGRALPPLPPRPGGRGPFAESWWGRAWVRALEESALDPGRLSRGRTYARGGYVEMITVTPGRITAPVRGSRPRPYRTVLRLPVLDDVQWDGLLAAVAARPAHIAALLERDMPHTLVETAEAAGIRLLPGPGELDPGCSCPDRGHPCKHAAALCYQTARFLDRDPFVLLLLRGRGEDELLDDLARRSAAWSAREASAVARGPGPHGGVGQPGSGFGGPEPEGSGPAAAASGGPAEPATAAAPAAGEPGAAGEPDTAAETGRAGKVRHVEAGHGVGVPARDALASRVRPPLPDPLPPPATPGAPPPLPALPGAPDPDALAFLAADAAARAHAWLTGDRPAGAGVPPAGGRPSPAGAPPTGDGVLGAGAPWPDAVRLAATHPYLTGRGGLSARFAALARATGRPAQDLVRATAAWRQGGAVGLAALEEPWDPPAGGFDRARGAFAAAGLPRMTMWRNRLTDPGRLRQLRYGTDGRWYPYRNSRETGDDWWPEGPAHPDPVTAFTALAAAD